MTTITELREGKTINYEAGSPTASIVYSTNDATDEDDAIATTLTGTSAYRSFAGITLVRDSVTLGEVIDVDRGIWLVTVSWIKPNVDPTAPPEYSITTIGGTELITQSLSTVSKGGPKVADFKQAIGFDGQRVNGVDVPVKVVNFEITVYKEDGDFQASQMRTIYEASTCVNSEAVTAGLMGNFDPGELLFHGANITHRIDDIWEIVYQFSATPNRTNLEVGDMEIPEKQGWDYLWMTYEEQVDAAGGEAGDKSIPIRVANAYYVERVFHRYDLILLDIEGWSS